MCHEKEINHHDEKCVDSSSCMYGRPDGADDIYKECDCETEESRFFEWCLQQASDRYQGLLSQEQLDKLNALKFPWKYYEDELDKLGYNWEKNKPKK